MKYLKVKITTKKDEKDDSVIHYFYDKIDVDKVKRSIASEHYLYVEADDDVVEGNETVEITKKQFDEKIEPKLIIEGI